MKFALICLLTTFSLSSFADCYSFINGDGPTGIAAYRFSTGRAASFCFSPFSNYNYRRSSNEFTADFKDARGGDLGKLLVRESTQRCGTEQICKTYTARYGRENQPPLEFKLDLIFSRETRTFSGTMTDNVTGQTYPIVKQR
jgi:hypothetical protein